MCGVAPRRENVKRLRQPALHPPPFACFVNAVAQPEAASLAVVVMVMVPVRVVVGAEIATTPTNLPHTDGYEGKVNQRRFNGRNKTASKVWVKDINGKGCQVHSKEDARRKRLRRRTSNTARCVEYERLLGNLSPLWHE